MRLSNVEIKNFRLLEDLTDLKSVDLKEDITVLVGKNNSGKTSFSYLFDIFLNNKQIKFDDFSLYTHKKFIDLYREYNSCSNDEEKNRFISKAINEIPKIQLIITLKYGEKDNWSYIRELLTSLDESDTLKIVFEYSPKSIDIFLNELVKECKGSNSDKIIIESVKKIINRCYVKKIRPWSPDDNVEEIDRKIISRLISSCFINAKRDVDDSNTSNNNKLSEIFRKEYMIYNKTNNDISLTDEDKVVSEDISSGLETMNKDIDKKLSGFFNQFIKSFSEFGYPNIEGSEILLKSDISVTNLFSSIMIFYKNNEYLLPEEYNGLGYSNLIFIISQILNFRTVIKENGTDLNIIFIEEPEAHMHPQLQCTFISKLNTFLNQQDINAQVILTTHSSHMISNTEFDSIRYFNRCDEGTIVKDLMKFREKDKDNINFLKQYITQVKCDMFFADKVILIEGTSERLLMPLFIEKLDKELVEKGIKRLSEQYISLIEISGAYMHIFKEFLEFIDVKTLIITDIDSCERCKMKDKNNKIKEINKACEITKDNISKLVTTNQTLKQWKPREYKIEKLYNKKIEDLTISKIGITYQRNYYNNSDVKCGRSFEEAFIIDNAKYLYENKSKLKSIKNKLKHYNSIEEIFSNSYSIYSFIDRNDKKTQFAFDLMYTDTSGWNVPTYIKEGLLWLAK